MKIRTYYIVAVLAVVVFIVGFILGCVLPACYVTLSAYGLMTIFFGGAVLGIVLGRFIFDACDEAERHGKLQDKINQFENSFDRMNL